MNAPTPAETATDPRAAVEALPAWGVWSPAIVPLGDDLVPDGERFVEHVRWLLENGCHGVAVFGTTGEANSFSVAEREGLLETLVAAGVPPERLMVGTGCCALTDSVRLTAHAAGLGCRRVLMLPPFYYKPASDEGLFRSFAEVVDRVGVGDLTVLLYHFPRLSGVPITAGLVERLLGAYPETFVGIKDSSGDWDNTAAMLDRFPGLAIFPGTEKLLLAGLEAGGAGCITACANAYPGAVRGVFDAWRNGAGDAAARQTDLTAWRVAMESEPMVPGLKFLAGRARGDAGWRRVRPPLVALEEAAGERLAGAMEALGYSG